MTERWYKEAVVYSIDVAAFQDSNDDGVGDLPGLISRLDYLSRLGVSCLWLNPVHPSPNRDDRYDVVDYYGIDPVLGSLGDFAELVHQAGSRGMRVLIDLVVNHTSDEHPWFQSARRSRDSRYRDWYVWSDEEPPDRAQGVVFPGEQEATWTWDDEAQAWYYHRFYDFQPDLNWANPEVRAEIRKVMAFWLQLGVSGFRVDAAPFVIEEIKPDGESTRDFAILDDWASFATWRRGDAVLLAEANVPESELVQYFSGPGGHGQRFHMLFGFLLNARTMLALARENAEPLLETLRDLPQLPRPSQWATFLRNHDEVDLSRLTTDQRRDVFEAFGPDPRMQIYGRGLRRRLAPMLGNDPRRIRMAYSLQLTLPGTPVLRYGEEIGMAEDLSLHGRAAVRTAMQWDDAPGAGFSGAPPDTFEHPIARTRMFGPKHVNVTAQSVDPESLLAWFERCLARLRECPEVGAGQATPVDVALPPSVTAHRMDSADGTMLFLHNLADVDVQVDIGDPGEGCTERLEVFSDGPYEVPSRDLTGLALRGYGYRWIRLRRGQGYQPY
ncbi:MAG: alpha-amylase family protein [Motilibacteraceae bacterium]